MPRGSFHRIYFPTENRFCGIEVEFVSDQKRINLYLNTFTLEFPFHDDDPSKCDVSITVEGEDYPFLADRLEGGQRLVLPLIAQELIVNALLNFTPVHISAGSYYTDLEPLNFYDVFNKL